MAESGKGDNDRMHSNSGTICDDDLILEAGSKQCRGPQAFMDDITVMTTSIPRTRWVLLALEQKATWARMN